MNPNTESQDEYFGRLSEQDRDLQTACMQSKFSLMPLSMHQADEQAKAHRVAPTGWVCPRCNVSNAPTNASCCSATCMQAAGTQRGQSFYKTPVGL